MLLCFLYRRPSSDMSRTVGDLNMKLKMEMGALREDKEELARRNEQIRAELRQLEGQLQVSRALAQGKKKKTTGKQSIEDLRQLKSSDR
jgi:hypothetical protein